MKNKLTALLLIAVAYVLPTFLATEFNPINWHWANKVFFLILETLAVTNLYLAFKPTPKTLQKEERDYPPNFNH